MRRVAAMAFALVSLTACSGEQGERAQQLLDRAQAAQAGLNSMAYELRVTFTMEGQQMSLLLDGAAYTKGPRAGDQVLTMRTEGVPGAGALSMQMTLRGGALTMNVNGRTATTPVPAASRQQYDWSGAMLDLARYVKRVKVREGRVVNGERGATVAGTIDTEGLLKAASRLQALGGAAGAPAGSVDELAEQLGDTHAALFIAERTGLIRSAAIGLTVENESRKADVDITYRLKSVNQRVPGL